MRASVEQYTALKMDTVKGPDFGPYECAITSFYAEHPEYRNIPFIYLMQLLMGSKSKTAEELYSLAKAGNLITSW